MPLDKVMARKLVSGARSAYARGVHSEFIQKMADQLEAALAVSDDGANELSRSRNEVTRIRRELDEEKTHYRKLRESSDHIESSIAVFKAIAASPKGAAKKAADQLALMGVVDEPVAPAKIEVV